MIYSFEEAKDIVLRATYETLVYHSEFETFGAEEVHKKVTEVFSAGYVRRILKSLSNDGLIDVDQFDETSPPHFTVSDEGLVRAEKLPSVSQQLRRFRGIPASDRIVSLDHNRREYTEIAEALDGAIELAEQTKPNELSGDEHHSLVVGLKAARQLWSAFELTQIQIEIGIMMAIEKAEEALKTSFQLVKGPLLMEALKAFFASAKDGDLF